VLSLSTYRIAQPQTVRVASDLGGGFLCARELDENKA